MELFEDFRGKYKVDDRRLFTLYSHRRFTILQYSAVNLIST